MVLGSVNSPSSKQSDDGGRERYKEKEGDPLSWETDRDGLRLNGPMLKVTTIIFRNYQNILLFFLFFFPTFVLENRNQPLFDGN